MFSAISTASSCAAGNSSSGGWTLRRRPARKCLGSREHAARVHPLGRLADPDDPGEEPARARLGHDAPAGEHETELRVLGREPDVHRQGHRHADTDRGAVDRGDHGLLRREDAKGQQAAAVAHDRLRTGRVASATVRERLAPTRQIGTGAEASPPTGHDDRTDVVVGVGLVEGRDHLVHHPRGERVELLRTIEGDRGDLVLDGVVDLLVVGHARDGRADDVRRPGSCSPRRRSRWCPPALRREGGRAASQ